MNKIKKRKGITKKLRRVFYTLLIIAGLGGITGAVLSSIKPVQKDTLAPISDVTLAVQEPYEVTTEVTEEPPVPEIVGFRRPYSNENTVEMDTEFVTARNSVLIDADSGEILARHNSMKKIYPASMTKVMTLLVAAEHLDTSQMNDTYTMTYELIAPLVQENASRVGFSEDETVTVKDMLYGLVLPSGADAAVGLCNYIAGSEEEFVKLMNEKAEELGLRETHFTNSSGLHDKQHYTTCIEMAIIMKAAMDIPICREILSTYTYTTSSTEQHPDGIVIYSSMFSRMYGTEVDGVTILAGKTGYTDEAAQCLVSYAEKGSNNYILVLAGDYERYQAVYSTFYAYDNYLPD